MKKTMLKLMIALLTVSSFSVSTHAADDFEALLNALNEGSVAEETTEPTDTVIPVDEINLGLTDTSGEIDLDSLTVEPEEELIEDTYTPPVAQNTYSNEATILLTDDKGIEIEPESNTDSVDLETVENAGNAVDYTAPRNDIPQLTVTGMTDTIYLVVLFAILGGVFYIRRQKSV